MLILGSEDDAVAVPGSVKVSTTSDNGIIKKKITFERSDVSDSTADALEGYKVSRLIATYVDESGKRRVAGSPDCRSRLITVSATEFSPSPFKARTPRPMLSLWIKVLPRPRDM